MEIFVLYLLSFVTAFIVTALTLPCLRYAFSNKLADKPGGLKTHQETVPTVGGSGILIGIVCSLVLIRFCTDFPTGTLHNLRGILLGSLLIFSMGLWDDLTKPSGLPIWTKLLFQAVATGALIYYGVLIEAFETRWIAWPLTFLWVVGLTNAFNLLDIQNGLCVTQAIVCTAGLTLITLPREYIYVNFAALAVLGSSLAFWPHNYSQKRRIFLGDSGSNLLGFLIAALSLGYGYSTHSTCGFLAPLLMLAIPLFDTALVCLARVLKGRNPLKGSNDHAALRLKAKGWKNHQIILAFVLGGLCCNFAAFLLTRSSWMTACFLFGITLVAALFLTYKLLQWEPK